TYSTLSIYFHSSCIIHYFISLNTVALNRLFVVVIATVSYIPSLIHRRITVQQVNNFDMKRKPVFLLYLH
uniref:hypothetical protein n=1 Tax=Photobacterium sanctipauli TaxID=1342794 RepID=UPI001C1DE1B9